VIDHQHAPPALASRDRTHQACRARAYDQYICFQGITIEESSLVR
jgi:hypothetical protein